MNHQEKRLIRQFLAVILIGVASSGAGAQKKITARSHPGVYVSPDHKYSVQAFSGMGDTVDLQIYPVAANTHGPVRGLLPKVVRCSAGYLWVPGKPHTLVFGTSGMYGEAKLAMWKGGKTVALKQAKRPADEAFRLFSVSADGKTLYYGHGRDDQSEKRFRRKRLALKP